MEQMIRLPEGEQVATLVTVIISQTGKPYVSGPEREVLVQVPGQLKPLNIELTLEILLIGIKTIVQIAIEQAIEQIGGVRKKKVSITEDELKGEA